MPNVQHGHSIRVQAIAQKKDSGARLAVTAIYVATFRQLF
jgi:hypothetical protein